VAWAIIEGIFAFLGVVFALVFARFHLREFRKGLREGRCRATAGGHAMRPWLMRCRACGQEETVEEADARARTEGAPWPDH
jgi:hypothetical protein